MAQKQNEREKTEEMTAIFRGLNEKGQESAITVLRALKFAQSVMCQEENPGERREAAE